MLKKIAIGFGVVFVIIGLLGFFEPAVPRGQLFGIFEIDTLHNWVHLTTGIIALVVGFASEAASRRFFQIFGIIYAIVAILGFFYGDAAFLGIMAHDWADAWLHVAIAAFALYFGYGYRPRREAVA